MINNNYSNQGGIMMVMVICNDHCDNDDFDGSDGDYNHVLRDPPCLKYERLLCYACGSCVVHDLMPAY